VSDRVAGFGNESAARRLAGQDERDFPGDETGQSGSAYLPGVGVRFYLDGKALAGLPIAFASRAFFAI
jgi:hypothetical protein